VPQGRLGCELYLVVEAGDGAASRLSAAMSAAEAATVLVRAPEGRALDAAAAKPLVEIIRRTGVAALVAGDAALARASGADGVHLALGKGGALTEYQAARGALGEEKIIGIDAGLSRHDAMTLAEAGADYVTFGAPGHLKDRDKGRERRNELIAWWAEIFQVPCVAFDVETAEEAEALARDGADFVAVTLHAGLAPGDAQALATSIAGAISMVEPAQ
jgi:thiamine-phosphate pyrophosphorylase